MTTYMFSNDAHATLASAITAAATTLTLSSGQGSLFPQPTGGKVFMATLMDAALHQEIVMVTARAVDTLTVVRAQEGTVARTWNTGDTVELRITAASLNELFSHAPQTSGAHAASAISFTPGGSLASTDVQGALVELDLEKQNASGTFPYSQLSGAPKRFLTGQYVFIDDTVAPIGTLPTNGLTIGNAASGATARANADTADLFAFIWRTKSNTIAPIQTSTGAASTRGASADADFAAGKRLPLPDIQDGEALVAAVATAAGVRTAGVVKDHSHTLTMDAVPDHEHTQSVYVGANINVGSTPEFYAMSSSNPTRGASAQKTLGAGAHTPMGTISSTVGGAKNKAAGVHTFVYIAL